MLRKLKRKFVLTTTGIVFVLLAVILGMLCAFVAYSQHAGNLETLRRIVQSAATPGAFQNLPRDVELPYFVVYVGNHGEYLAGGYTGADLTDEAFLSKLIKDVSRKRGDTGVLFGRQLMYAVDRSPGLNRIVFLDISSQNTAFHALISASLLVGIFSLAVFVVLSIFLAQWMVRPVERAWAQQQQFVSDASHELKTPLTVIISNAELLRSEEFDEVGKAGFADNILVMSRQMRSLVENLLKLARVDNGQVQKSFTKLDFSEAVSEILLPFEPVFFEKGLRLEADIQPNIKLLGSEHYLRQMVEILLDNAQKYTAAGVVKVSLCRQGRRCLLSVANPGEPIPKGELTKIFERFYRMDRARSRDGSFGLGLAIAKSVAQEHKGRIWAESYPNGNSFYVELPCE